MKALWLLVLAACDDHLFQPQGGDAVAADWCGVEPVLAASCATSGCHDAGSATAGLDLETDPLAALVDVEGSYPGLVYVVPGDPDASYLLQKIEGTQASGTGSRMPLGPPLDDASIAAVRTWISDGAADCGGAP